MFLRRGEAKVGQLCQFASLLWFNLEQPVLLPLWEIPQKGGRGTKSQRSSYRFLLPFSIQGGGCSPSRYELCDFPQSPVYTGGPGEAFCRKVDSSDPVPSTHPALWQSSSSEGLSWPTASIIPLKEDPLLPTTLPRSTQSPPLLSHSTPEWDLEKGRCRQAEV